MTCWLIDNILLERHDDVGFPPIAEAAKEAGHSVILTKYVPFSEGPDAVVQDIDPDKEPVICYGSIQFMNQLNHHGFLKKFWPGGYYKLDNLKVSAYSSVYGKLMLNDDFIMLPWGEIERRSVKGIRPFGRTFFIRPDAVTKSFAGRVLDLDSVADTPTALSQYDYVPPDTICVLASEKEILSESRHLIVDGKVITESQYRFSNVLDIRTDIYEKAKELAERVARHSWQPDNIYIVDIAVLHNHEAKIIEFNSFSCSGLYAMDTRKIVKAVGHSASLEFLGIYSGSGGYQEGEL